MGNVFIRSIVQASAFMLVVLGAIIVAFYFGPGVEAGSFPVVVNARIIPVPNDPTAPPDSMRVLLHSVKVRQNCELVNRLVSVRMSTSKGSPDEWVRGSAFFKDEGADEWVPLGKTRPIGDVIVDQVQIRPKGVGLHIVLVHKCHPFWLTTTTEAEIHDLDPTVPTAATAATPASRVGSAP